MLANKSVMNYDLNGFDNICAKLDFMVKKLLTYFETPIYIYIY